MPLVALIRPRVAFLHTASSNAALFGDAVRQSPARLHWNVRHEVRPDLLEAASGDETAQANAFRTTRRELQVLRDESDVVVLTCSSLGPALEGWEDAPSHVLSADGALAEACAQTGGRLLVLYTAPSSKAPTSRLFGEAAARSQLEVECREVEGAWSQFLAGRHEDYVRAVASAVLSAEERFDRVALAQASMAAAISFVSSRAGVLTVPDAVVARLETLLNALPGATV